MKKIIFWSVIVALVGLVLYTLDRAVQGPDREYWIERAAYDRDVADRDVALRAALEEVGKKDLEIAQALGEAEEAKAKRLEAEAREAAARREERVLEAENSRLRTELQPVIDANPRLKELVRSFDLRLFNKDVQIKALTLERDRAIEEGQGYYKAYVAAAVQVLIFKKQYEDEHALRLSGDALTLNLESRYKSSKFWAKLGKWGPPVAFGLGLIFGK